MLARALAVWFAILLAAILNGAIRDLLLVPPLGDQIARAISCVTLAAAILFVTWLSLRWIHPQTAADRWTIGGAWLAMTLAFEFLAGHYFFGTPWDTLLADYDVFAGRLWIVVLVVTLIAPALAHRFGQYPRRSTEISSAPAAHPPAT